jgi:hypothetical protein
MRYKTIFTDNTEHFLFGEEFFSDTAVRNRVHHTNLIDFSIVVCEKGRPIEVFDSIKNEQIKFESTAHFDNWFYKNQSSIMDFGFSDLSKIEEIIQEGHKRVNIMLDYFDEELIKLEQSTFDPWRIDGGYKELEKISKLGITSMNILQSKNKHLLKNEEFNKLNMCFNVINKTRIGNHNIITFSKLQHEQLDANILRQFCRQNIVELKRLLD